MRPASTSNVIVRLAITSGFLMAFFWPRYFYVSIGGKGISAYEFTTLVVLIVTAVAATRNSALCKLLIFGFKQWWPILILAVYLTWRVFADLSGDTPWQSVSILVRDYLFLVSWLWIGAVAFADQRLVARLPVIAGVVIVLSVLLALLEMHNGQSILVALKLNGLEAGEENVLQAIDFASSRDGSTRAKSVFSHPIVFGQVLASLTPFAVHLIRSRSWLHRSLGLAALTLVPVGVLVSQSRSPFVLLALSIACYTTLNLLDLRRPRRILAFITIFVGAAVLAPATMATFSQLVAGRDATEARSSEGRNEQADRGLAAANARPLIGYGDGNAGYYAGVLGRNKIVTVDNLYLSQAVETGYVGVALFTVFLAMLVITGAIATVRAISVYERSLSAAVTSMAFSLAIGLTVISITDQLTFVFMAAGFLIARSGRMATSRACSAFPPHARRTAYDPGSLRRAAKPSYRRG